VDEWYDQVSYAKSRGCDGIIIWEADYIHKPESEWPEITERVKPYIDKALEVLNA